MKSNRGCNQDLPMAQCGDQEICDLLKEKKSLADSLKDTIIKERRLLDIISEKRTIISTTSYN